MSCANYLSETDYFYPITCVLEYDSKLTGLGHRQSNETTPEIFRHELLKDLKIAPILFTSILARAMQTSSGISQSLIENGITSESTIIAIPYIEELPFSSHLGLSSDYIQIDKQNQPRNINEVIKDIGIHIDTIPNINPYDPEGEPVIRVDVDKFYEVVVPEIIEYLKINGHYDENAAIVVVSHRKTIKQATGICIGNVGAVLQTLEYDATGASLSWGPGTTEIIFKGHDTLKSIEKILENDLDHQRERFYN